MEKGEIIKKLKIIKSNLEDIILGLEINQRTLWRLNALDKSYEQVLGQTQKELKEMTQKLAVVNDMIEEVEKLDSKLDLTKDFAKIKK